MSNIIFEDLCIEKTEAPKILFKDGGLWKDGIKLIPEFGNVEHINALRKYDSEYKKLLNGVYLSCDYEVTAFTEFKCLCGNKLQLEAEAEDCDDTECFEGKEKTCYNCKRHYELIIKRNYRTIAGGRKYCDRQSLAVVIREFKKE